MSRRILGLPSETLRKKVRQAEIDEGRRQGLSSAEREEIKKLTQGERGAARANEILRSASLVFRARARPRPIEVSRYIDEHVARFGVEPICRTLGVSASAYYQRATGERSARVVEDERLLRVIRNCTRPTIWRMGIGGCGRRSNVPVRRRRACRVQRLMAANGIVGAKRRGKPWRTTKPDPAAARPRDLVERNFTAHGAGSLVGRGFHVSALLGGGRLFQLHHRRVLRHGGRLAAGLQHAHHAGARRFAGWRSGPGEPGADFQLIAHTDAGSQYTSPGLHAGARRPRGARDRSGRSEMPGQRDGGIIRGFVQDRADRRPGVAHRDHSSSSLSCEYIGWFNHQRLHEASATSHRSNSNSCTPASTGRFRRMKRSRPSLRAPQTGLQRVNSSGRRRNRPSEALSAPRTTRSAKRCSLRPRHRWSNDGSSRAGLSVARVRSLAGNRKKETYKPRLRGTRSGPPRGSASRAPATPTSPPRIKGDRSARKQQPAATLRAVG